MDENFPKDVRTSAQSLFNLLILGLGPLVGNFIWGWLGDFFSTTEPVIGPDGTPALKTIIDYHRLFLVPMAVGLMATVILAIFFHPRAKDPVPEEVPVLVN